MIEMREIPVKELEELERSRVKLYDYLQTKLTEAELLHITNITGQMWMIANRKLWDSEHKE